MYRYLKFHVGGIFQGKVSISFEDNFEKSFFYLEIPPIQIASDLGLRYIKMILEILGPFIKHVKNIKFLIGFILSKSFPVYYFKEKIFNKKSLKKLKYCFNLC